MNKPSSINCHWWLSAKVSNSTPIIRHEIENNVQSRSSKECQTNIDKTPEHSRIPKEGFCVYEEPQKDTGK